MGHEEVINKIKEYSDRVVDLINPKMVVLYGSYARGTAHDDSDIDIAVICDSVASSVAALPSQRYRVQLTVV